jgi:adenylate kinase family enzyme
VSRVVIFGNSGSGKSTLAGQMVQAAGLAHLDLDTLAWKPASPPQREALAVSAAGIECFIDAHESWVVEGCYTDLIEIAAPHCSEIIYLNLPVAQCMANARARPWEPHKYPSKAAQDANLAMLLDWIAAYETRDDEFSRAAHQRFYERFAGPKAMPVSNEEATALLAAGA